jgi:hypothetical protein
MNNMAPTINLDVLWSDGMPGADEAKRKITAKKNRTATAMAPNTVMILTGNVMLEAEILTLLLGTAIYSDSRNNLELKYALYRKVPAKNSVECMAKRSKHTKLKAKSAKLSPKSEKLTPSNRRMSSEDFLKKAERLWRAGPEVKYRYPDSWQRALD